MVLGHGRGGRRCWCGRTPRRCATPECSAAMFREPRPLHKQNDRDLCIVPRRHYHYARDVVVSPLLWKEVAEAAHCFPILFQRDGDSIYPIAVYGFSKHNVFVDKKGNWNAPFIPSHIQAYPFCLMINDKEVFTLGVDGKSDLLCKDRGLALIQENGTLSKYADDFFQSLINYHNETKRLKTLIRPIAKFDIFSNRPLHIKHLGANYFIHDYITVDENRLSSLPIPQQAQLISTGIGALIYAHLFSLKHLPTVAAASDARERMVS